MCVYVCFVAFYMFVLHENHLEGHKLLYEHICGKNIWVRLNIGPKKGPQGGPQLRDQHCQAMAKRLTSRQTVYKEICRPWVSQMEQTFLKVQDFMNQPKKPSSMGRGLTNCLSIVTLIGACCLPCFRNVMGEFGISPQAFEKQQDDYFRCLWVF